MERLTKRCNGPLNLSRLLHVRFAHGQQSRQAHRPLISKLGGNLGELTGSNMITLLVNARTLIIVLGLVLISALAAASEPEEYDRYAKAVVHYQSKDPTCFQRDLPLRKQMAELNSFSVNGPVKEPIKMSGPHPTTEMFEGIEIARGVPVMELVINKKGEVESVVSLRSTKPEFDARIAQMYSQFIFEPASESGSPICTRYILTIRIK